MTQAGADTGAKKIEWARAHMPLLAALRTDFLAEQPFTGKRLAMSIHLEAKTACLALLLRDGGAEVFLTGSNPLSTQDAIVEALRDEDRLTVNARRGRARRSTWTASATVWRRNRISCLRTAVT